jgi:glutamate-1-semialdehyde aminotransferase/aryl-alcohol dehydrogenase-like predicted oxidoreductase
MYLQDKIILGTAQTDLNYGFNKNKNLSSLINTIKEKKFTLDTAPTYKNVEFFFAAFHETKIRINSKLPAIECKLEMFEKNLIEQIKLVFKKVDNRNLDTIFIHDPLLPLDKNRWKIVYKHLTKLKKAGRIKKIGASVYNTYELNRILKVFTPNVVQFPVNIFNQSFLKNDYLKKLKKKNIELHARSIFLQGLLLQKKNTNPKYFKNWELLFNNWYKFLKKSNSSGLEMCLQFIFNQKIIDKYIIGVDNSFQLEEIIKFIKNFKYKQVSVDQFDLDDENLTDPRFWKKNKNQSLGTIHKKWIDANNVLSTGGMLLSKKPARFLKGIWPTYFSKAKGCYIWDLNGKKYLDFSLMGIGTNILGYAHKKINASIKKTIDNSNVSTLNSYEEVILSKKFLSLHNWADSCFFAKTGGEANTIAIRIARSFIKKNKIAICGYHGWHDWYLSANLENKSNLNQIHLSGLGSEGIPKELSGLTLPFKYNDISSFKNLIKKNPDIGIVFMEVQRNEPPKKNFLSSIRKITHNKNIILIFDECTSGFRENFGGLHLKYKVTPDICIFGKSIANGIPITAIIGKRNVMDAAKFSFISSTFWTDRLGFSGALSTLKEMERVKSWKIIKSLGKRIKSFWFKTSEKYKIPIKISGLDAMPTFEFCLEENEYYKAFLIQFMLEKRMLVTNTVYCSTQHEKYLHLYFYQMQKFFRKLQNIILEKSIMRHLEYPLPLKQFSRLN